MTLREIRAAMARLCVPRAPRHGRRLKRRTPKRQPPLLAWSRVFDLSPWERMTMAEHIRRALG